MVPTDGGRIGVSLSSQSCFDRKSIDSRSKGITLNFISSSDSNFSCKKLLKANAEFTICAKETGFSLRTNFFLHVVDRPLKRFFGLDFRDEKDFQRTKKRKKERNFMRQWQNVFACQESRVKVDEVIVFTSIIVLLLFPDFARRKSFLQFWRQSSWLIIELKNGFITISSLDLLCSVFQALSRVNYKLDL